jgi:hypothetical protein
MKTITCFVAMLACASLSGCAGQDTFRRFLHGDPVVSGAPEINDNVFLLRNGGEDETSYTDTGKVIPAPCSSFMDGAHQPPPSDPARIKLCVYAMHELIDVRFHRFEHEISAALSTSHFVADVSVLGLTTAATLASVDSAKILSAIAAGITGTRKSWDEDILYSYSIQAILQQMRTDRALVDTQIQARLAPGGKPYDNIYEASNDLFNYDVAGSWEHAMSSLQQNVAATTAACQARLRNQQLASAAGAKPIVPIASTASDPCSSVGVASHLVVAADIKKGAIFVTSDGHTIKIASVDKTGKVTYDTQQLDGTWPNSPTANDSASLLPNLVFLLQPGSS